MPPKLGTEKVKAKSSPTRSKVSKISTGEGKKLSSLSSLQATLNFKKLPSTSTPTSSSSGSSSAPARLGSTSTTKSTPSVTPNYFGSSSSSTQTHSSSTSTSKITSKPSSPGTGRLSLGSTSRSNGSDDGDARRDSKLMPPPPAGLQTKSRIAAASVSALSKTSTSLSKSKVVRSKGSGKGKEIVYELEDTDSDDDDDLVRKRQASSSKHTGMWADIYLPKTETDLAPGKARITKVKNWLHEALYGCPVDAPEEARKNQAATDKIRKYRRILLLSGPAGAGKATTVRVLAKDMGIDLMEWGEGAEEWSMGGSGIDRESSISKFSSFLSRNTYAPLQSTTSTSTQQTARPRVLFFTSLPNISHNATKETFHASLRDFCKSYSSSSCPLVIVHSDVGTNGLAEESWRDRERGGREGAGGVLGKEVKDGPWCVEIDFLSVAPTFQIKALKKVLENASATSPFPLPTVASVQLLALNSNGDLRSAVNSLQMLCMRIKSETKKRKDEEYDENMSGGTGKKRKIAGGGGSVVTKGRGSRGGKGAKLDVPADLRAVLDVLSRKEQSLHLFHALGRVLYNKRLDDPATDNDDQSVLERIMQIPPDDPLPEHLQEFERRKSLVQMEAFVGSIPLDSSSFTLWLHQNVPSFCTTIDQAAAAADEMCSADIMRTEDDIWQSSQQAISYALQISIRGTQLALPSPVPRNHQKIVKPQFFNSFKAEKHNLELLDMAAAYLAKKAVAACKPLIEIDLDQDGPEGTAAWGGFVSRKILAGELVPMLVKMQGLTDRPLLPASVAPLRMPPYGRISTRIEGEELTSTQTELDDDAPGAEGEDDEAGVLSIGWDREDVAVVVEEKGWLEDDDIQDWD